MPGAGLVCWLNLNCDAQISGCWPNESNTAGLGVTHKTEPNTQPTKYLDKWFALGCVAQRSFTFHLNGQLQITLVFFQQYGLVANIKQNQHTVAHRRRSEVQSAQFIRKTSTTHKRKIKVKSDISRQLACEADDCAQFCLQIPNQTGAAKAVYRGLSGESPPFGECNWLPSNDRKNVVYAFANRVDWTLTNTLN